MLVAGGATVEAEKEMGWLWPKNSPRARGRKNVTRCQARTCDRERGVQACREALRKENLRVEWQQSNKRWVATFYFPRHDESLHVIAGDELILQHESGALPSCGGQPYLLWLGRTVHVEQACSIMSCACGRRCIEGVYQKCVSGS